MFLILLSNVSITQDLSNALFFSACIVNRGSLLDIDRLVVLYSIAQTMAARLYNMKLSTYGLTTLT